MFDTKTFTNSLQKAYNQSKFQIKKHSPEILIVSGIAGVVASFIMTIKATTKLDEVLDEGSARIEDARNLEVVVKPETGLCRQKTEQELRTDVAKAYTYTALHVAKLYAPSVLTLGLSITAIVSSHNIMQRRNLAITAAYTALDKSFTEYQKRVAEKYGEDTEKELRYGVHKEKLESEIVGEDGKTKKTKENVKIIDKEPGPYSKFFDECSRYWEKDAELNLMFLRRTERYLNDILRRDGYLFLCDVYKALDIAETRESRVVGWIYDPNDKERANNVDFGLYDAWRPEVQRFVNGYERTVLLDFNPDGVIINEAKYPG